MKVITKIALLIINEKQELLLARKEGSLSYILPGGRPEGEEDDKTALIREIMEELQCVLLPETITYIDEFRDKAANEPDAMVAVRLYQGAIEGTLIPSNEIAEIRWASFDECHELQIAPSIKNGILPFLRTNGYL